LLPLKTLAIDPDKFRNPKKNPRNSLLIENSSNFLEYFLPHIFPSFFLIWTWCMVEKTGKRDILRSEFLKENLFDFSLLIFFWKIEIKFFFSDFFVGKMERFKNQKKIWDKAENPECPTKLEDSYPCSWKNKAKFSLFFLFKYIIYLILC